MNEDATSSGAAGSGSGGASGSSGEPAHPGELALRRLLAGEPSATEREPLAAHVASCAACNRRLDGLADEQRAFEERISFDRFAAGVERAARVPSAAGAAGGGRSGRVLGRPAGTRSFLTVMSVGALAAGMALYVGARPLFEAQRQREAERADRAINRIKGGAAVDVRVGRVQGGPQRAAAADVPEALSAGELVRVGVRAGDRRYLFVVSIDAQGGVTPLFPEVGTSIAVPPSKEPFWYLPESVEFTGPGMERLVALLSDAPLELDGIRRAVAAAFRKAEGDVTRLGPLAVPGDQFHRVFLKP